MTNALYQSDIPNLDLINNGKVRDIYAVDDKHMLIIASDRLSAFDVILSQPIPGKGEVLTRVANFWFSQTIEFIPNHLTDIPLCSILDDTDLVYALNDRAIVVKKLKPLPIEAVVRGYLIGSGWKDYQKTGEVCGIPLPDNLKQADQLPQAIFTPSTKAAAGEHDENISFDQAIDLLGKDLSEQVKNISCLLYTSDAADD